MLRRTILLFLMGMALIFVILYLVDPMRVWDEMQNLSVKFLMIILSIQILIMLLSAIKWRVILMNSSVSIKDIIPATLVGYLVNNITPFGLAGGEPVRAYILSRACGIRLSRAASSVIVDLFLEIFPIFALILISITLIILGGEAESIAIILGLVGFGLFILSTGIITLTTDKNLILIITKKLLNLLERIPLMRSYSKKKMMDVNGVSVRFESAMREYMGNVRVLVLGTFVSIIGWVLKFLRIYLIFIAIGYRISITSLIIVETLVLALSFIPILPGALGTWEGSSIALFMLFGVDSVIATTVTIIDRFFFYVFPSILGIIASLYCGVNLSKIIK